MYSVNVCGIPKGSIPLAGGIQRAQADLDDRLYRMYDKIEELESKLVEARAKKQTIEAEKLTRDNIYKVLIYFDKLYAVMNGVEKRQIMEALIAEVQVYEERQANGQWLKSIKFKLPIIEEDMNISLDNDEHIETESFQVKVSINNLNIRTGPGTGFAKTGKYTGKGVFTIVETSEGTGSAAGWGLLKAYQSGRDGWISLEHAVRV